MTTVADEVEVRQCISSRADDWAILAQHAVDVAMHAGAQYADARLTRTVRERYGERLGHLYQTVGVGVRVLVNGCWGFVACPSVDMTVMERLARDAVAQAIFNARGSHRTVDLSERQVAIGTWATPVAIDPFTLTIEEKSDFFRYLYDTADEMGLLFDPERSNIDFARQERVVATSDGSRFSQTTFESGGRLCVMSKTYSDSEIYVDVRGIEPAGRGWELLLDAKIPDQLITICSDIEAVADVVLHPKPAVVGRYTLVCDGTTMAGLLNATLGVATQLDRALGYEANAGGTSFLDDPLTMIGTFRTASPLVTVKANRSASAQLATVKWDDEGVIPLETTLIQDGILRDFQTTREQAAWLAPYYTKAGRPIRSNGCAAAESGLFMTMQHPPNLSLRPNPASIHLNDLIGNVKQGLLIERGQLSQIDAQGRTGLLVGRMSEINNGRLGSMVVGGGVQFNAIDLWKKITALGGLSTQTVLASVPDAYRETGGYAAMTNHPVKGEPPQATSRSIQAVAATIENQAIINPDRVA